MLVAEPQALTFRRYFANPFMVMHGPSAYVRKKFQTVLSARSGTNGIRDYCIGESLTVRLGSSGTNELSNRVRLKWTGSDALR